MLQDIFCSVKIINFSRYFLCSKKYIPKITCIPIKYLEQLNHLEYLKYLENFKFLFFNDL